MVITKFIKVMYIIKDMVKEYDDADTKEVIDFSIM